MEYNDYELVYMVKENEEVLEYMIKKYEPLFRKLAYSFVFKQKNRGLDVDDIIQQCRIILCRALDSYNYKNDVLFYTFLLICLKRGIINYIKRNGANYDINYMDYEQYDNLDYFVSSYDAYDNYIDYEAQQDIVNFKNSLNFLDSSIFELRYNGFSYKDIASLLEIEEKKVDNILFKIRKKLEKYFLFL
jgi:RNA polymerase sigma factor (sigma-70 family)